MFETLESVRSRLRAGEDSFTEFKEIRFGKHGVISPNADDIAGEMVAFVNGEGGAIFLGVDDRGTVVGLPSDRLRQVEEWIVNLASGNCDPPIRPVVQSVVLPGDGVRPRHVLIVKLKQGLYVHRTGGGRWLVRVGSTKRDLTQPELSRLFQERGRTFAFDESVVPGAASEDLDMEALEGHLRPPKKIEWQQLLVDRRVLGDDEDGELRPTVAGLLCFGHDPSKHLYGAMIEAAVYRGLRRHSDDLVHAEQIRGPIDRQIDGAVAFVHRFMLKPARKHLGRVEYPQFNIDAVQEAIVNAVAHRDYSVAGSKIRVYLYADRLEIISPGGLPNTLTLETLRYRQFTRNQLLVSFLAKMRSRRNETFFLEERGEGVTLIIEESLRHSGREPEYALHGPELHLTIWAQPSPHGAPNAE